MTSTANSRSSSRSINTLPIRSNSPHTTSSSLRPRYRKLLSTELLDNSDYNTKSQKQRTYRDVDPLEDGRVSSSLPKPHLTRPGDLANDNNVKGKGIWEGGWSGSWTTLQGIANAVLGSDVPETAQSRVAANRAKLTGTSKKSVPASWGPSGNLPITQQSSIAGGSLAERDRAVRARKTASVLESHERINGSLDTIGRFKRRTSVDTPAAEDQDEQVLVYVHHVEPKDTVTGVILRYNCQPAAFRKANRLWPNDILQIRRTVLLPVDVCNVKGRPCNGPEFESGLDLLAPTPSVEIPPISDQYLHTTPWNNSGALANPSSQIPPPGSIKTEDDEVPLWTHVRWVVIDSTADSKPVSISRIHRKDLGYFPPRRRKSNASSAAGTPRASIDVLSHSSSLTSQAPSSPQKASIRRSSNLSSQTNPYFPSVTSQPTPGNSRSASTSRLRSDSATAKDNQLSTWMKGPGGVGTFAKNVRKPGPAQDGLNSWAAKHLPSLTIDNLPSRSIANANDATWRIGPITEEQQSFVQAGFHSDAEEAGSQGMGLENAAATIEGWVRKLASRAPGPPGTPKLHTGTRHSNGPDTMNGVGDLIELLDGSDDGRGFETATDSATLIESFGGLDREDLIGTVRGRTGKGGKGE